MNDDELAARFRALRNYDEGIAPAFLRAPIDAQRLAFRARRRRRAWYSAAGVAVVAAAAVVIMVARPKAPPFPIDLASTTWAAPSDFLLDTPGSALLRTIPGISISNKVILNTTPPKPGDTSRRNNE